MKTLLIAALSLTFASEYPQPNVREEQEVLVDGVREVWQLQWKSPPHPSCVTGDPGAFSCPCQGFAYGEAGPLEVVRLRKGKEIDRMPIRDGLIDIPADGIMAQRWPTEENDIIVQRWLPEDGEPAKPESAGLEEMMAGRPPVQLMTFADYDHDGEKTEFFFRTGSTTCGRVDGIVIGISKNNPRLHAFGTATDPNLPLILSQKQWEDLSKASRTLERVQTPCGEAGADRETTLRLGWNLTGITAEPRQWTCPGGFKSGRLVL